MDQEIDTLPNVPARSRIDLPPGMPSTAHTVATGLGWFSIAMGVAELLMPRRMAGSAGLRDSQGLLRLYGLREIAVGAGLLTSADKALWLWGRVAGDAVDLATLGAHLNHRNARVGKTVAAIAAVAGVAALDIATAQAVAREDASARRALFDYSDRIGLPSSPEAMRGAALSTFEMPADMAIPPLLRPYRTA